MRLLLQLLVFGGGATVLWTLSNRAVPPSLSDDLADAASHGFTTTTQPDAAFDQVLSALERQPRVSILERDTASRRALATTAPSMIGVGAFHVITAEPQDDATTRVRLQTRARVSWVGSRGSWMDDLGRDLTARAYEACEGSFFDPKT